MYCTETGRNYNTKTTFHHVGLRDPIPNAIASFAIPLSRSVHYAQHGILLLANHYASSLHNWKAEPLRLFKILRHYLPPILLATTPDRETPPSITAFISARPRKSILRNLYHTHKLAERTTPTPTFPPHIQVVLPQLLNKNTSFPFNSLSRRTRSSHCPSHIHRRPQTQAKTSHHKPYPCVTPMPLWRNT
jgi:hypothetical protein